MYQKTAFKKILRNILITSAITIASNSFAADYTPLWTSPIGQSEPWVALFISADKSQIKDQVHLAPRINHISEKKDPFSNVESYVKTTVSCRIQLILMNLTESDIAARGAFGGTNAPIAIKFIFNDQSSHIMQGNFGFTRKWGFLADPPILNANSADILEMVSIESIDFDSKEDSQEFLDSGGCKKFANVTDVEIFGSVPMELMRRGSTEWVPIENVMEIAIFK